MLVVVESMRDNNLLSRNIDTLDFAGEKLHPSKQLAHGIHNRGQIQVAGRDLMQHRSEQEKVIAIDEPYLDAIMSEPSLQLHRGRDSHEAPAEYEYSLS